MEAKKKDDRHEAPAWFTIMILDHAMKDRGMTGPELGELLGGKHRAHVSMIRSGRTGVGFDMWMLVADWQGKKPGALLDEALEWWEAHGRAWRAQKLREKADDAAASVANAEEESARTPSMPPSGHSAHKGASRSLKSSKRVRRADTGEQ